MHDPEWFWHISDPKQYWYKGKTITRDIDSQSWVMQKIHDSVSYVFEWSFATMDWKFYDGQPNDERYILFD